MVKKLFIILLMGLTTFLFAQTIVPKKCNTCGKPLAQCQYKGRHPSTTKNSGKNTKSPSTTIIKEIKTEEKEKIPQKIEVSFGCTTNSATIFINGKNYGSICNKVMLNYGKHNIKVTCDGYQNYEEYITVDSNNYYFFVRLKKLDKKSINTRPAEISNIGSISGTHVGYAFVDLGLPSGLLWSEKNVGAQKASDYGDYFAWGEIRTKDKYTTKNCFDNKKGDLRKWVKYKIGGKTKITPNSGHDAARENWKGNWRMPSESDFKELYEYCTWSWVKYGGHYGYMMTSKKNGNSIFLPAAGWRNESTNSYQGEVGAYWSSELSAKFSQDSQTNCFNKSLYSLEARRRDYGRSVRPVLDRK